MPVLVQQPGLGPQNIASRVIDGLDASRSLMDRADANERANAAESRQQQLFQATAPLRQAEIEANMAKAKADVASIGQTATAKKDAYEMLPNARSDFDRLMTIPDDKVRADAARQYLGRYSQLANINELKGEMDQRNHVATSLISDSMKLDLLNQKNDAGFEMQRIRAQAAQEKADLVAQHQSELNAARIEAQQAKLAASGSTEYLKERGKAMAAVVTDVQGKVPQHQDTIAQIGKAREILDSDVDQGRGMGTVLQLQKAANSFIPGLFDTTKKEILEQTYAQMALTAAGAMKGQGQITESERRLLADTVAQFGNSPEAARYIMDFMEATAKREIARADYYNEVEDREGMVKSSATKKFYEENPISAYLPARAEKPKPGQKAAGGEAGNAPKKREPIEILGMKVSGP